MHDIHLVMQVIDDLSLNCSLANTLVLLVIRSWMIRASVEWRRVYLDLYN